MQKYIRQVFNFSSSLKKWATILPQDFKSNQPPKVQNLINGEWREYKQHAMIVDPMNRDKKLASVSLATKNKQLDQYVESQKKTPPQGLHNPIKNVSRYIQYGDIFFRIAKQMRKQEVNQYFTYLVQKAMPKSRLQAEGEVIVTRRFFENFSGDNPRFMNRSFNVSGDHNGQTSSGYRWPYGNVCVITPFNFPIEIPALQLFGSLLVGNKPLLKCDTKMSLVMQQFLRLAIHCGMPPTDVNFINCSNESMEYIIEKSDFKVVQFTGSGKVAQHLAAKTNGKVRIEDAGMDWKILGPDVSNLKYVAWVSDQDAYAASGQKCSAQSLMFVHENWIKAGFLTQIQKLAKQRKLQNLTISPIFTWNNKQIESHIKDVLKCKNTKLLFGGNSIQSKIPQIYGCYQPTAIQVPLTTFQNNFELMTKQLFGPFQIIIPYKSQEIQSIIGSINSLKHFLTAGVVSNDVLFLDKVLGSTKNGVTYSGIRARTTGAPQNHWFGPTGDPRGAGIGTKQAILTTWTTHRQIIRDYGPISDSWKRPPPS